jgi:excisionase family DNA binding protein
MTLTNHPSGNGGNAWTDERKHMTVELEKRSATQLPPDLLTVRQAAKRLGLHPDSLYRLIRARQFPPAVTIGRSVRVSVPELERFLHGDGPTTNGHDPSLEARLGITHDSRN